MHLVLELFVEPHLVLVEPIKPPIHAHANQPALFQIVEHIAVFALPRADNGREDHEPIPRGQTRNLLDNLLRALTTDLLAAPRTMADANRGKEHAQIIVNLGHRAHRRARIVRGRLLLNGDARRQAANGVIFGLVLLPQKLPRVGRQALDIAALPLGIERVKGQRTLARPGNACQDHQLFLGNIEIDPLEIVFSGATNRNHVWFSQGLFLFPFKVSRQNRFREGHCDQNKKQPPTPSPRKSPEMPTRKICFSTHLKRRTSFYFFALQRTAIEKPLQRGATCFYFDINLNQNSLDLIY